MKLSKTLLRLHCNVCEKNYNGAMNTHISVARNIHLPPCPNCGCIVNGTIPYFKNPSIEAYSYLDEQVVNF